MYYIIYYIILYYILYNNNNIYTIYNVLLPWLEPHTSVETMHLVPEFMPIILSRLKLLNLRSSKPGPYLLQTGRRLLTSAKLGHSRVYESKTGRVSGELLSLLLLHTSLPQNTNHELETLHLGITFSFLSLSCHAGKLFQSLTTLLVWKNEVKRHLKITTLAWKGGQKTLLYHFSLLPT